MITAQRRSTDEIIGVIRHRETQRKAWLAITALAYIVSTAFLIRASGRTWSQSQVDFVYAPLLNALVGGASFILYRLRVRGGERIGYIMPFMLTIVSCMIVWMVTH